MLDYSRVGLGIDFHPYDWLLLGTIKIKGVHMNFYTNRSAVIL